MPSDLDGKTEACPRVFPSVLSRGDGEERVSGWARGSSSGTSEQARALASLRTEAQQAGWASGSSGLGPVSSSSWATTLAFRGLRRRMGGLRKLGGWRAYTLQNKGLRGEGTEAGRDVGLLTWGGWVLVTLPPAFLHSWARAASSTTDSSRAIPREWKSHAQGHSAGWWKCQEAASSSPARPCPLCLMCPVGTSLPDSRRTTEGGFGCRL
ncbi:uncharacterized protein LOC131495467 isoform X2 [Neofelis nebulosa]|uniref:uncharacterized protein LOC131495467 isoform X2 n=1 Tax=Neofelis nebulosa TaxID=61452 RepID=UPI00272BC2B3|nr:uncharacterized protein LOC131495467 isoform X2 [Neofelis nebulosa]